MCDQTSKGRDPAKVAIEERRRRRVRTRRNSKTARACKWSRNGWRKKSGGAAGRTIRRIIVVTTYGGSWWLVRVALGDPARKVVSRAVRSLCARGCRVDRYVHYNMDHSTPRRLSGFLDRVRAGVSRLLAAPGAFPEIPMPHPHRIEGYAIVSEDGMLANAAGIMPDSLQFEADKHFFEQRPRRGRYRGARAPLS